MFLYFCRGCSQELDKNKLVCNDCGKVGYTQVIKREFEKHTNKFGQVFNTTKDQLYHGDLFGDGTRIESKREYKRELKKRGLIDDFDKVASLQKKNPGKEEANRARRREAKRVTEQIIKEQRR